MSLLSSASQPQTAGLSIEGQVCTGILVGMDGCLLLSIELVFYDDKNEFSKCNLDQWRFKKRCKGRIVGLRIVLNFCKTLICIIFSRNYQVVKNDYLKDDQSQREFLVLHVCREMRACLYNLFAYARVQCAPKYDAVTDQDAYP